MKAQLSLEFLIYMTVSAAALVLVLSLYIKGSAVASVLSGKATLEELVAVINTNMGYQTANFTAYIPSDICDASLGNRSIEFSNSSYFFDSNISMSLPQACEHSGEIARVTMFQYPNQTYLVEFSGART